MARETISYLMRNLSTIDR